METRAARVRSWFRHLLVYPATVVAAAAVLETMGLSAFLTLGLCAAPWLWGLVFRREATRTARRIATAFGIVTMILLVRQPVPERVPDDLAEVAFRTLLEEPEQDRTYFLEVDGRDASPALLRRLGDLGATLKPRSAAAVRTVDAIPEEERGQAPYADVRDRETGQQGTLLRVANLSRDKGLLLCLAVDIETCRGPLPPVGERCLVLHLRRWRIMGAASRRVP